MEEMVVVVMAVIVEDMRHHLLAMVLPLQVMALPLQAMGLLVATADFSSYQGIKETKTKIRATEAVMAVMVEGTCVIAMALLLLATLVLLHLFPPPPAGRWLKQSMSPALRNSAL